MLSAYVDRMPGRVRKRSMTGLKTTWTVNFMSRKRAIPNTIDTEMYVQ